MYVYSRTANTPKASEWEFPSHFQVTKAMASNRFCVQVRVGFHTPGAEVLPFGESLGLFCSFQKRFLLLQALWDESSVKEYSCYEVWSSHSTLSSHQT